MLLASVILNPLQSVGQILTSCKWSQQCQETKALLQGPTYQRSTSLHNILMFLSNIKNLSLSNPLGWELWLTWGCGHLGTKPHLYTLPWRCSSSLLLFSWTRIVYSQLHLLQPPRQRSAALLDTCFTWFLPSRPIALQLKPQFPTWLLHIPLFVFKAFPWAACCPFLLENSLYQWLPMYWGGRWCLNLP